MPNLSFLTVTEGWLTIKRNNNYSYLEHSNNNNNLYSEKFANTIHHIELWTQFTVHAHTQITKGKGKCTRENREIKYINEPVSSWR